MLYLDSFNLDWTYWHPSATHHLKELTAAWRSIDSSTLAVIDDNALAANLLPDGKGSFSITGSLTVGGNGRLVGEFAEQVGARQLFVNYQTGWIFET